MAGRLFGTDGVRGVANGDVLNPDVALSLGRASALFARERGAEQPTVVVGRDTRRSGPMLEDALCAGIAAAGGVALRAGVIPTPAVAWLVREQGASLGAVISASHNPFPDNGIKLFGADGFKLEDEEENRVEALLDADGPWPTGAGVGESRRLGGAAERYAAWVAGGGGTAIEVPELRVLVDCANGAASTVAPLVFAQLGIEHEITACEPDGININDRVGSTHLDALAERVVDGRLRPRARVRRRRRPHARGRRRRRGRGRRPDHRPARARHADRRPARRQQGRRDVDVEPRLPPGDARARHRDGRDRRRRPLRARGHARARPPCSAASSRAT